ncbi:MAG TPA: double zinc ribbon domain-containing protein [Ktedonobacteraceae bacterium]
MHTPFSQRARALFQSGLDLLFPPHCAGCQRGGSLLCPVCWQTMQPLAPPLCQICGTPLGTADESCPTCRYKRLHLHGLRSVSHYQGPLRKAVHALKYDGQQRLAEPLGLLLAEAFRRYGMHADGIIPLPLHPERQRQRGYNQAAVLARACAANLRVPCLEDIVFRQRITLAQVGLTLQERQRNVAGAFALTPDARTRLAHHHTLLLLDYWRNPGSLCRAPLCRRDQRGLGSRAG